MATLSTREVSIVAPVIGGSSVIVGILNGILIHSFILPWWMQWMFTASSMFQVLLFSLVWGVGCAIWDRSLLKALIDQYRAPRKAALYFTLLSHLPLLAAGIIAALGAHFIYPLFILRSSPDAVMKFRSVAQDRAYWGVCCLGICGFIAGIVGRNSLKNRTCAFLGLPGAPSRTNARKFGAHHRRDDDDIDDRTFDREIKKKFGRTAHYEPHTTERTLPYWILEVLSRLLVGGTYLCATFAGLVIGYYVWAVGATLIAERFFNYQLGKYSFYAGLVGAVVTSGHFVAHWGHYFYLQSAKRLHRINMGAYGNVFLERGHTLGDMIYALSYLIIRGVIPWVAFGLAGYIGYHVSLPVVPDKQWSFYVAVGIAIGAAVFANSTAEEVIDHMFEIKNLPDPERHQ